MNRHSCLDSILDIPGACQVPKPCLAQSWYTELPGNKPGTLISWATPGETTQAGIRQGAGRELSKLSAGSSQKLIELPLPRGSFSINGPGSLVGGRR